jgi:hypothetical protein
MKFKCKQSGVVIELVQEQDIKSTKSNPAYEVYEEPVVAPKKETKKVEVKVESVEE